MAAVNRILTHRRTIESVNPGAVYALATDAKLDGAALEAARADGLIFVPVFWDDPAALALAVAFLSQSNEMPAVVHPDQESVLAAIADQASEVIAVSPFVPLTVSFVTQNLPAQSFINFGGKRFPEQEFIIPVENAVEYAERGEREFYQVLSSTRKLLRYVWDVMQKDGAHAIEWNLRWRVAAERFAVLEEQWGERPNRYWLH
jgi:hypothetical protein